MIFYCQLPPGVGKVCGDNSFKCQSFPHFTSSATRCREKFVVTTTFIANHFHVPAVPRPGVGKSLGLSAVVRIAFITNRFHVPGVQEKVWFEWRCLICGDNCAQLDPGSQCWGRVVYLNNVCQQICQLTGRYWECWSIHLNGICQHVCDQYWALQKILS